MNMSYLYAGCAHQANRNPGPNVTHTQLYVNAALLCETTGDSWKTLQTHGWDTRVAHCRPFFVQHSTRTLATLVADSQVTLRGDPPVIERHSFFGEVCEVQDNASDNARHSSVELLWKTPGRSLFFVITLGHSCGIL